MHGNVDMDVQKNKQVLSSRQIRKSTHINWQTKGTHTRKTNNS